MLIEIRDDLILDDSQIIWAERCGNYTDIWTSSHGLIQIWDKDETAWSCIKKVARHEALNKKAPLRG